jgi:hypothetical protein
MTTDTQRIYSTRRLAIVNALVEKLKGIDGENEMLSNVYENVHPRLKFWDEVDEFPAIHVSAGSETREYQGAGYKDRFLSVNLRIYVNEEDAVEALEKLLEDVETVVENNSSLTYYENRGQKSSTQQITVVSITTDEGVLEPLGVGEMLLQVRY